MLYHMVLYFSIASIIKYVYTEQADRKCRHAVATVSAVPDTQVGIKKRPEASDACEDRRSFIPLDLNCAEFHIIEFSMLELSQKLRDDHSRQGNTSSSRLEYTLQQARSILAVPYHTATKKEKNE